MKLETDPARAAEHGVPVSAIARTLALAAGERVGSYRSGGDEVDVVVSLDGGIDPYWQVLYVRGRDGVPVPLTTLIRAQQRTEPAELLHLDGRRAVVVWAQGDADMSKTELQRLLRAALPGATVGDADPRNVAAAHW